NCVIVAQISCARVRERALQSGRISGNPDWQKSLSSCDIWKFLCIESGKRYPFQVSRAHPRSWRNLGAIPRQSVMDSLRLAMDDGGRVGCMQDQVSFSDLLAQRALSLLALCALLAGCTSGAGDGPYFFADAGKYQFHSCEQLAAVSKQKHDRQRELKELI